MQIKITCDLNKIQLKLNFQLGLRGPAQLSVPVPNISTDFSSSAAVSSVHADITYFVTCSGGGYRGCGGYCGCCCRCCGCSCRGRGAWSRCGGSWCCCRRFCCCCCCCTCFCLHTVRSYILAQPLTSVEQATDNAFAPRSTLSLWKRKIEVNNDQTSTSISCPHLSTRPRSLVGTAGTRRTCFPLCPEQQPSPRPC